MARQTTITADQMQARGLPPLEISWSGEVFTSQFPDPKTPLYYCGPPGGPNKLLMQIAQLAPGTSPFSLEEEVRKHDLPEHNFVLGDSSEFEVGGTIRPVLLWSIKVTPWLDTLATTFIPVSELNAIVLITFSAWKDARNQIATHQQQRLILSTLTVTPKLVLRPE